MLLVLPTACSKGKSSAPQKEPAGKGQRSAASFPVEVAKVEAKTVEYVVRAVGSVDAFEQVQVTARVAGVVDAVRFAEGDAIKKGAVLVEIEPERYALATSSARASLARAEAAHTEAKSALARREEMLKEGLVSIAEVETLRARVATSAAETSQARASLDLANLNLRDARVRAPVEGTIQTRSVRTGQYVQPGTVLATLLQREPLLVRFKVPEHEATRLRVEQRARFNVRGELEPMTAVISHVADSAEPSTRMVAVVAKIESPPPELRAGVFAEVVVPVGAASSSPVIPETAVRPSERGFLTFVVEDDTAKERVVELGLRTEDGLIEVRKGLSAGDALVVHGAEALRDGAKVVVSPSKSEPRREDGGAIR